MTAVAHAPATAGRSPAFAHQPALDGLRGVSVLLVLCFHARWPWMSGGYVGVSVFFTLSGFLITGVLLRNHLPEASQQFQAALRFDPKDTAALFGLGVGYLVAVALWAGFWAVTALACPPGRWRWLAASRRKRPAGPWPPP